MLPLLVSRLISPTRRLKRGSCKPSRPGICWLNVAPLSSTAIAVAKALKCDGVRVYSMAFVSTVCLTTRSRYPVRVARRILSRGGRKSESATLSGVPAVLRHSAILARVIRSIPRRQSYEAVGAGAGEFRKCAWLGIRPSPGAPGGRSPRLATKHVVSVRSSSSGSTYATTVGDRLRRVSERCLSASDLDAGRNRMTATALSNSPPVLKSARPSIDPPDDISCAWHPC